MDQPSGISGLIVSYTESVSSQHALKIGKVTLVVPKDCLPIIVSVGHENPLAEHFSHKKTGLKVGDQF